MNHYFKTAFAIAFLFVATNVRCDEVIPPGIHPKMSAGAGQTVSRGPSALFYNPANLIFSKFIEPYADVSFAQVNYSYQNSDVDNFPDPAVISVGAPPITAGLGLRFVPSFALGAAVMPTATGAAQIIPNVPVRIGGQYLPSIVQTSDTSIKIAAGTAFRFAHAFTIGAGIIHGREKKLTIILNPDTEERYADFQYAGSTNEFTVGARSELFDRAVVLAFSYKTAAPKVYAGDVCFQCDQEPASEDDLTGQFIPYEGAGYSPAAIGVGAEARFGIFGGYFDILYEQWSAGRQITRKGYTDDPLQTDLIDTLNIVGGIKVWFGKHMLTAGGGLYPANIGDGTNSLDLEGAGLTQEEEEDLRVAGVQFGDLEAIPVTAFSGGYRYKIQGHGYLEGGVYIANGARAVQEGFDYEGNYTLSIFMGSFGLAFGF